MYIVLIVPIEILKLIWTWAQKHLETPCIQFSMLFISRARAFFSAMMANWRTSPEQHIALYTANFHVWFQLLPRSNWWPRMNAASMARKLTKLRSWWSVFKLVVFMITLAQLGPGRMVCQHASDVWLWHASVLALALFKTAMQFKLQCNTHTSLILSSFDTKTESLKRTLDAGELHPNCCATAPAQAQQLYPAAVKVLTLRFLDSFAGFFGQDHRRLGWWGPHYGSESFSLPRIVTTLGTWCTRWLARLSQPGSYLRCGQWKYTSWGVAMVSENRRRKPFLGSFERVSAQWVVVDRASHWTANILRRFLLRHFRWRGMTLIENVAVRHCMRSSSQSAGKSQDCAAKSIRCKQQSSHPC